VAKYNLDPVTIQEVRCVECGSQAAEDYTFFHGNENANHHLLWDTLLHT